MWTIRIRIKFDQNANKYTFNSNSFLFSWFSSIFTLFPCLLPNLGCATSSNAFYFCQKMVMIFGGTAQLRAWEGTVFTAAFFIIFIAIVFAPDIEGVQNKVICLWIGTTYSVKVASMFSTNLYDINREPFRRAPNLKQSMGSQMIYRRL